MYDEKWATCPTSSSYRGREVLAPPQPVLGRQHVMDLRTSGSGRQAGAALATARRDDRATGARPHTQPEAVGLRTTTVVRLEGALAHSGAPEMTCVSRETDVGRRLAVTVRPRVARNARVHRFLISVDRCPSEAGGSSHRQLDFDTVRAAVPCGQTSPTRHSPPPSGRRATGSDGCDRTHGSVEPASSPAVGHLPTPCGQRLEVP